jgi:hypothetical protein
MPLVIRSAAFFYDIFDQIRVIIVSQYANMVVDTDNKRMANVLPGVDQQETTRICLQNAKKILALYCPSAAFL